MTTTVVHLRRHAYDVRIDRATKWGNPFKIGEPHPVHGRPMTRAEAIQLHREWLPTQPELMAALHELRGRRLGCWCKPLSCHGDTLAEFAENVNSRLL